jgi:two-component system cell cycle sensor histidine kinase/response regulator CckA
MSRPRTDGEAAPEDLERLRESEASYRRLFEVNPHPMWVYDLESLRFLAVNEAAVRRYGHSRGEFLALTIRDIRPPEDVPALLANVEKVGRGLDEAGLWRHRLKDGSIIDVEITSHTLDFEGRRAELVQAVDLTGPRRTEETLRWLQRAIEQTDDAVFLTGLDGAIAYVNPGFEKLYGYAAPEALGQTPRILKSGEMSDDHYAALWHTLRAGRNYRATHLNRARDGRLLTVDASITVLRDPADEPLGYVAIHHDMSERRRLEEERRALEAQLVQAQRFEALGTLAAGVAHDFNNLLGIVLGHAAALARRPDDSAAVARGAESIRLAGERGAGLVRQVLTFAGPSEGAAGVVDAWAVAAEVERMLRDILPGSITMTVSPDPGRAWVRCDHTQLHQALLNLCLNARDAMPSGGTLSLCVVRTTGARARTYCPEATGEEYVEVSVVDSGVGMSEETRRRVFDPFFTTKPAGRGSGLGLAVVFGIVRAHGGYTAVESARWRGSSFRLFFPASLVPPPSRPVSVAGPDSGRTILFAEDEEILAEVVVAWLRDAGHKVVVARDGEEAVARFRERSGAIDLVLCDLGLPGLGGREVFFALRGIVPAVRFVILTGYVEPSERAELAEAGVAAFLDKPCRVEELLDVVSRVLAEPGRPA